MTPPIILVTATSRSEAGTEPERVRLNVAYLAAVERAGGIPLVAPPLSPEHAPAALAPAAALLLTGGEDVDPAIYGAEPHPALGRVTRARDDWEIALVHAARAVGKPVLGICRGIQVLNVALGGTLVQDIPSAVDGAAAHDQGLARAERTHPVDVAPESRLSPIYGHRPAVNSIHHQAIAQLAPCLRIVARAPDGVVEAVESCAPGWWAVGVQWHPEELDGGDAGIFAALVDAARPAPVAGGG